MRPAGTGSVYHNGRGVRGPGTQYCGEYKVLAIRVYGSTYEEASEKLARAIEEKKNKRFGVWTLIKDCVVCGRKKGNRCDVREVGNHIGIYCKCGKWQKWISRQEAGVARNTSKRKAIKPKIRFQIFQRDGFRCVFCGCSAEKTILHIDHIVPVTVAKQRGWSAQQINNETNLQTLCAECNLGKGSNLEP